MTTSVLLWVLFGVAAGVVARVVRPQEDVGWVGTILLSIVGSLVGGGCAWFLQSELGVSHVAGVVLAMLGAVAMIAFGALSATPQKTF